MVSIALTSAAWGVGGLVVMPPQSVAHQAVVYFFLIGMCSGTAAIYSAHVLSVAVAITLIMAPSTLYFALQDDVFHRGMAFGTVIYVTAAARATKMLNIFLSRSWRLTHELQKATHAAEAMARTDALTGLRNRRAFYELGDPLVLNATRSNRACAVVMLDIDRFKAINDRHGHGVGDEGIRSMALVLTQHVREGEIAGRLGGEEFGVVLPDATLQDALQLAERLRQQVEAAQVLVAGTPLAYTASFGVAVRGDGCNTLDELLARADKALYAAKEGGRNRVVAAEGEPSPLPG